MIEIVAKAIYEADPAEDQETDIDGRPLSKPYPISWESMSEFEGPVVEIFHKMARAAIEAMHNPLDEVVQAMCEVAIDGPGYVDFYPSLNDCGRLFNAAINEILHGSALSQSPSSLPSEDR